MRLYPSHTCFINPYLILYLPFISTSLTMYIVILKKRDFLRITNKNKQIKIKYQMWNTSVQTIQWQSNKQRKSLNKKQNYTFPRKNIGFNYSQSIKLPTFWFKDMNVSRCVGYCCGVSFTKSLDIFCIKINTFKIIFKTISHISGPADLIILML